MEFQKTTINYLDILVAVFHYILIVLSISILPTLLSLSIIVIVIASMAICSMLYVFLKNNPFYIYYSFGLLICGIVFLILYIPSLIPLQFGLNFFILIFFLMSEGAYVYSLTKGNRSFSVLRQLGDIKTKIRLGRYGLLNQSYDPNFSQLKIEHEKQQEIVEKKYNSRNHLILSTILNIALFVLIVFSF
ncbi:MAG: hypothetical protein ACFE8N_11240 [Promethearchaeota archaeon]